MTDVQQLPLGSKEHHWREYQILSNGYVGTMAWGYSVVSLFATFSTAMLAGAGYIGTQLATLNMIAVTIYSVNFKLGNLILLSAGFIGIASALWGPAMVLAHAKQCRVFLRRMQRLELEICSSAGDADKMFAHQQIRYEDKSIRSKFVQISTGFILMAIFFIWLAIILKGAWLNV
jgi:hypothetical protein